MKITFVLPTVTRKIIGGYKIVYEYSNKLVEKGYEVSIVYNMGKGNIFKYIERYVKSLNEPKWFELNRKVKKIVARGIDNKTVPDGDIIIATAYKTSLLINNLSSTKGKKIYLVQGFENWGRSEEEVYESYKLGLVNIAISKWLKERIEKVANCEYIPNGIDFNKFKLIVPVEERNNKAIAMMYHTDETKNAEMGIRILKRLKNEYPDLVVNLFGVPARPNHIPQSFKYIHKANQNQLKELYNSSSIFLCTSKVEGFGLTGAESMACGCVLVSTDCKGILEYAIHERNSLLSPVGDENKLYENIIALIENKNKRIELAKNALNDIEELNWNKSISKFEKLILKSKEIGEVNEKS